MPNEFIAPFEHYARVGGAQVFVAGDEAAAATAIAESLIGDARCTAAVRDRYPGLIRGLEQARGPVAVAEEISEEGQDRSALAAALSGGTGVVLARAGVAETGSLVLADDALVPRLVGMLSDVCVALLPESAILPGLDEAGALLSELNQAGHRYVSLVSGPSRTADIERVLTIGVQGPKALHIIVLTEEGAPNGETSRQDSGA